jgi:hypothetical protein
VKRFIDIMLSCRAISEENKKDSGVSKSDTSL